MERLLLDSFPHTTGPINNFLVTKFLINFFSIGGALWLNWLSRVWNRNMAKAHLLYKIMGLFIPLQYMPLMCFDYIYAQCLLLLSSYSLRSLLPKYSPLYFSWLVWLFFVFFFFNKNCRFCFWGGNIAFFFCLIWLNTMIFFSISCKLWDFICMCVCVCFYVHV